MTWRVPAGPQPPLPHTDFRDGWRLSQCPSVGTCNSASYNSHPSWLLSDLILVRSCHSLHVQMRTFADFQYCSFILHEWLRLWHGGWVGVGQVGRSTLLVNRVELGTTPACRCFARVLSVSVGTVSGLPHPCVHHTRFQKQKALKWELKSKEKG